MALLGRAVGKALNAKLNITALFLLVEGSQERFLSTRAGYSKLYSREPFKAEGADPRSGFPHVSSPLTRFPGASCLQPGLQLLPLRRPLCLTA